MKYLDDILCILFSAFLGALFAITYIYARGGL
jgi:hypothetical protein